MTAPARVQFHLLVKPTGPICNLDCEYCYFLSKEALYPGDRFRMSGETLERYVTALLDAQPDGEVTIAWQGGEPTLMGIDFFRHAVALAEQRRRPGQQLAHTIQTNGTLVTDEWAAFFAEHRFLVGISIDGPPELHDRYRVDKKGRPTSARVLDGLARLRARDVDVNVLCTVNAANQHAPLEVYRYLRDVLGLRHIQFIPIVERDNATGFQEGGAVTARSVAPDAWGTFLTAVFDEWVRRDVGDVFVQMFDAALGSWLELPSTMCIFRETCGQALVMEHNGDVYSCDHYVEPGHLLGNIAHTQMVDLVKSPQQRAFGQAKLDTLPAYCQACEVRFACHGECPKNRFTLAPDGEPGLNYLCAGYRRFFQHIDGPMRLMADLLRHGRYAERSKACSPQPAATTPAPAAAGARPNTATRRDQ